MVAKSMNACVRVGGPRSRPPDGRPRPFNRQRSIKPVLQAQRQAAILQPSDHTALPAIPSPRKPESIHPYSGKVHSDDAAGGLWIAYPWVGTTCDSPLSAPFRRGGRLSPPTWSSRGRISRSGGPIGFCIESAGFSDRESRPSIWGTPCAGCNSPSERPLAYKSFLQKA